MTQLVTFLGTLLALALVQQVVPAEVLTGAVCSGSIGKCDDSALLTIADDSAISKREDIFSWTGAENVKVEFTLKGKGGEKVEIEIAGTHETEKLTKSPQEFSYKISRDEFDHLFSYKLKLSNVDADHPVEFKTRVGVTVLDLECQIKSDKECDNVPAGNWNKKGEYIVKWNRNGEYTVVYPLRSSGKDSGNKNDGMIPSFSFSLEGEKGDERVKIGRPRNGVSYDDMIWEEVGFEKNPRFFNYVPMRISETYILWFTNGDPTNRGITFQTDESSEMLESILFEEDPGSSTRLNCAKEKLKCAQESDGKFTLKAKGWYYVTTKVL